MTAPGVSAEMVDMLKKALEERFHYFEYVERSEQKAHTEFSKISTYDAIARIYFYLGQDDEAQEYFCLSIEGAKALQAEKFPRLESRPYNHLYVRSLYAIARPLWWTGDVTGRDYFEQAIVNLAKGREHGRESDQRMILRDGICFLIALDEMERAKLWLDELEFKYGLSVMQKSLETLRLIVEPSSPNSRNDLETALDQLNRQWRLDGIKLTLPYSSSPSSDAVVHEWLRRRLYE